MVKTLGLRIQSYVNILFILTQNVSCILGQYIVVLLQYACHISQYIAIRFWNIVTALIETCNSPSPLKHPPVAPPFRILFNETNYINNLLPPPIGYVHVLYRHLVALH